VSHVFGHGRLPAYGKAVEFYEWVVRMERRLSKHDACLAERLRAAAVSITMNIAGAAGASKRSRKASRYRSALAAVTECSAILDLFAAVQAPDAEFAGMQRQLESIAMQVGTLQLHATREVAPRSGGS